MEILISINHRDACCWRRLEKFQMQIFIFILFSQADRFVKQLYNGILEEVRHRHENMYHVHVSVLQNAKFQKKIILPIMHYMTCHGHRRQQEL